MLLVIDVGNSNIVLGIYSGAELIRNWRLSTDKSRTSDEYAVLLQPFFPTPDLVCLGQGGHYLLDFVY